MGKKVFGLTLSVLLQAMKQEPPADQKCRDKFLVQSVTITADKEFTGVQQIVSMAWRWSGTYADTRGKWDTVERSAIQEKKIRVSWLPANGDDQPPVAATPVRQSLANGVRRSLPFSALVQTNCHPHRLKLPQTLPLHPTSLRTRTRPSRRALSLSKSPKSSVTSSRRLSKSLSPRPRPQLSPFPPSRPSRPPLWRRMRSSSRNSPRLRRKSLL